MLVMLQVLVLVGAIDALSIAHPPAHVSPYWADPENHTPNPLPRLDPEDFAAPPSQCPRERGPCNDSIQYRPVSGRCVDPQHPDAGVGGHTMIRIVPAVYDDGVMRVRSAVYGLLPNPRVASLRARRTPPRSNQRYNLLFMQFGQFIDHDFSITTTIKDKITGRKNCRPCESWMDPACIPILLPKYDPYISPTIQGTGERRCLPVTRSVAEFEVQQGQTKLEQINLNTAFIDLSQLYGSDECRLRTLRTFYDGLLASSAQNTVLLKPKNFFPACRTPDQMCFYSGDPRSNENVGMAAMHIIFHREHNRLAKALKVINPHWDDERLFQEARRINIGQYQEVVYNEYLVPLIGKDMAVERGLVALNSGFLQHKNIGRVAAVYNEFTTAAFRMGHSQIQGWLSFLDSDYHEFDSVDLVHTFHNATILLQPLRFDSLLRGLMARLMGPTDLKLVDEVLNKLFKVRTQPHSGLDLLAINIARGRDHGLAPYTAYLEACGTLSATDFNDLLAVMSSEALAALRDIYKHVKDIDLIVGGLAETPLPGAIVGPTLACIIARQFTLVKATDRFWYEKMGSGLSERQVQALRGTLFSRIICQNMDQPGTSVPLQALAVPDDSNPLMACGNLPELDLELWREVSIPVHGPCIFRGTAYNTGAIVPVSPCLDCFCQLGKVVCGCDSSGCGHPGDDHFCRRVCGRLY